LTLLQKTGTDAQLVPARFLVCLRETLHQIRATLYIQDTIISPPQSFKKRRHIRNMKYIKHVLSDVLLFLFLTQQQKRKQIFAVGYEIKHIHA